MKSRESLFRGFFAAILCKILFDRRAGICIFTHSQGFWGEFVYQIAPVFLGIQG